jgi:predicted transposase YdaD
MNLLKESSFYKLILKEGREAGRMEGRKEGEKKGQLGEARKLLIRLGRIRFGRLDKATRTAIESIDDLERLERLFERVSAVSSWAELLAEAN